MGYMMNGIKYFNLIIYKNILKEMEVKKINSSELARKTGTTPQNVHNRLKKLEKGDGITTSTLFELANALDVSVVDLVK